MAKRRIDEAADDSTPSRQYHRQKRLRPNRYDRLSELSDELIIRILSFLDVSNLITFQRISRRYDGLATDSQLWKALYYAHFVRPRAARIPGVSSGSLVFSSKVSKWLDEQHLVRSGAGTNWKAQYKLRLNWMNGSSQVSELHLKDHLPPVPPLVRMRKDYAVSADTDLGLRIWRIQGSRRLLAAHPFKHGTYRPETASIAPSAIAIDESEKDSNSIEAAVGFEDGGFGTFSLSAEGDLLQSYLHPSSSNGAIVAIAINQAYLATVSQNQLLSLYAIHIKNDGLAAQKEARLICSLRSHTARAPLAISLRVLSSSIVASIAYVLPSYITGWNVGLQELRFMLTGQIKESRVASTTISGYRPLLSLFGDNLSSPDETDADDSGADGRFSPAISPVPTSLSYSHPYMLVSHPDNTLTLYLVHSSDNELTISSGRRLWGHTSSVSDAQVGDRGRAISASASGDEIRVWELEGMMQARKRAVGYASSVSVRRRPPLPALDALRTHLTTIPRDHRVVGFDQQKVVTMREDGERTLVVYDFS